jgi:hypothetical protein
VEACKHGIGRGLLLSDQTVGYTTFTLRCDSFMRFVPAGVHITFSALKGVIG